MKKLLVMLLTVCILFALIGCSDNKPGEQKSDNSSNIIPEKPQPHRNLAVSELPYEENWLKTGLSKAGLENVSAGEKVKGRFSESGSAGSRYAYLLNDYERYYFGIYHDSYLAVETYSKILLKDLALDNLEGAYAHEIYACDVDGDGLDEIVLQQTVGMTGGAGQYLSRIFKVVGGEIREIFNSRQESQYDTGFTGVPKDNFKLEIRNKFTGYVTALDKSATGAYVGVYFDESGKAIEHKDSIMCDSFLDFFPEDVDGDGIYELVCRQYVSLYGHTDYIGDAKSVLKFNPSSEKFEVIRAEFTEE